MIDVSVIIPTFNRLKDLELALDSVFGQASVRLECIVVDDGSTDGTVESIRDRYSDQNLVIIEKQSRSGPQASRNLGIVRAQGEFVTFLDSDDYFEPNTLADRVNRCRNLGLNSLFSAYRVRFVGRRWELVKNVISTARTCPADYPEALCNFKIAPMITIMYRRLAHNSLRLDETLASGHDDDLSLRLIRAGRFDFDDIAAATIIQHIGERIATPRNLMIGDAQLLQKYASDLSYFHGSRYLTQCQANTLAGLWSVGQFKHTAQVLKLSTNRGFAVKAFCLAALLLPSRWLSVIHKKLLITIVRIVL